VHRYRTSLAAREPRPSTSPAISHSPARNVPGRSPQFSGVLRCHSRVAQRRRNRGRAVASRCGVAIRWALAGLGAAESHAADPLGGPTASILRSDEALSAATRRSLRGQSLTEHHSPRRNAGNECPRPRVGPDRCAISSAQSAVDSNGLECPHAGSVRVLPCVFGVNAGGIEDGLAPVRH
jgi:hypothetical protein